MKTVKIEISEPHWRTIKKISAKLGLNPGEILQQEIDQSLSNMETWLERSNT